MAASVAMMHRHIVSTILHHLSDQKYKDRRQHGPDQPVEFLEFRPTLVPSILVNKLWADEGTSILWKRYPHLPALRGMPIERRQYYANKVQQVFSLSPPPGHAETLDYLDGLAWPNLKSLELEVDFQRHGAKFAPMFHDGLEHLELSGFQSGDSKYFEEVVLPALFNPCKTLRSIHIGPDTITDDDPIHVSALFDHLDSTPSINTVKVKSTNFMDKDALFTRLSQRLGLEGLEIDLDPGVALLPILSGPNALPSPFSSLKRLWLMCYPEVALALPIHLQLIEEMQLDIARIPNQQVQDSDFTIFEDLITQLSHCPHLRVLRIGVGLLAQDFPSNSTFPRLLGSALLQLAKTCSRLEDISLLAAEPSAIDASLISSEEFENFCRNLPSLRSLILKLHPATATALERTALSSIGKYCPELELLRIKVAFQLPTLPVPHAVPQILINGEITPGLSTPEEFFLKEDQMPSPINATIARDSSLVDAVSVPDPTSPSTILPLFPHLIHLAISRPENVLATAGDTFTVSSSSHSTSEIVDPDLEEDLVRSWAHPLLAHFPRLEILEAWGDWTGQDNESLNYFLPTEEILASTWEFLSGVEQDLWEDDEELEEGASWLSLESTEDDWDKASLMNEYIVTEQEMANVALYEEEPEGMITPGRTIDQDEMFQASDIHVGRDQEAVVNPDMKGNQV